MAGVQVHCNPRPTPRTGCARRSTVAYPAPPRSHNMRILALQRQHAALQARDLLHQRREPLLLLLVRQARLEVLDAVPRRRPRARAQPPHQQALRQLRVRADERDRWLRRRAPCSRRGGSAAAGCRGLAFLGLWLPIRATSRRTCTCRRRRRRRTCPILRLPFLRRQSRRYRAPRPASSILSLALLRYGTRRTAPAHQRTRRPTPAAFELRHRRARGRRGRRALRDDTVSTDAHARHGRRWGWFCLDLCRRGRTCA